MNQKSKAVISLIGAIVVGVSAAFSGCSRFRSEDPFIQGSGFNTVVSTETLTDETGDQEILTEASDQSNESSERRLCAVLDHYGNGGTLYSLEYDDAGQIRQIVENCYDEYFKYSEIDPLQVVKTYTYDDFGRLMRSEGSNGWKFIEYSYNNKGFLEKITYSHMSSGETSYVYDEYDRLIAENHIGDMASEYVEYSYNESGELIQVSVSGDYVGSETYKPGDPYSWDSRAAYYYNVMVEKVNESYAPFVISEADASASITDSVDNSILRLGLEDPVYHTDDYGYLTKIECSGRTYEFYYEDPEMKKDNPETSYYASVFSKLDYGILLGALEEAEVMDLSWDLADIEPDGTHELLIYATGGDTGQWYQSPLLADSDQNLLWYYLPSGAASAGSQWAYSRGLEKYLYWDSYGAVGLSGRMNFFWNGSAWEPFAKYVRSAQYDENNQGYFVEECAWMGKEVSVEEYNLHFAEADMTDIALSSPQLEYICVSGDSDSVLAAFEEYLDASGRKWAKDTREENKITYLIPGAANIWMSQPNDIAQELGQSNFDCALTVITAEVSAGGIDFAVSRTYNYGG